MSRCFFLLCILLGSSAQAQKHQLGVLFGGANLIGDVGRSLYVFPTSYALGVLYRFKLNSRNSIRLSLLASNLKAKDEQALEKYRRERSYELAVFISEISTVFEFDFFTLYGDRKKSGTPFMFLGGGFIFYDKKNHQFNDPSAIQRKSPGLVNPLEYSYSIHFGVGYKHVFSHNWTLTAEVGVRYSGTNDMDQNIIHKGNDLEHSSYTRNEGDYKKKEISSEREFLNNRTFGNIYSKDWYTFSVVSLAYAFGRSPCYCQ